MISAGSSFSRAKGPDGSKRIMKKVADATMRTTRIIESTRCRMNLSIGPPELQRGAYCRSCRAAPLLFLSKSCVPPSRAFGQLFHGDVLPVDKSQRRQIEVLDALLQEQRLRVVVDWKNGHIGHEDLLCGMQRRHARLRVDSRLGLCDDSIIRLVAPASLVISGIRSPHVQERVGVHVVTNPLSARNIVEEPHPVSLVNAPLLAPEGAGDTKVLLPHPLGRLANGFVLVGGGVVEQCEGREP